MKNSVFLIDDSVTIHRVIDLSIEEDKYDVEKVFTSEDAVRKLKTYTPDIILLDNKLEGIILQEFLKEIKSQAPSAKIVLLMGAFDNVTEDEIKKFNVDDYLVKPFNSNMLDEKLKNLAPSIKYNEETVVIKPQPLERDEDVKELMSSIEENSVASFAEESVKFSEESMVGEVVPENILSSNILEDKSDTVIDTVSTDTNIDELPSGSGDLSVDWLKSYGVSSDNSIKVDDDVLPSNNTEPVHQEIQKTATEFDSFDFSKPSIEDKLADSSLSFDINKEDYPKEVNNDNTATEDEYQVQSITDFLSDFKLVDEDKLSSVTENNFDFEDSIKSNDITPDLPNFETLEKNTDNSHKIDPDVLNDLIFDGAKSETVSTEELKIDDVIQERELTLDNLDAVMPHEKEISSFKTFMAESSEGIGTFGNFDKYEEKDNIAVVDEEVKSQSVISADLNKSIVATSNEAVPSVSLQMPDKTELIGLMKETFLEVLGDFRIERSVVQSAVENVITESLIAETVKNVISKQLERVVWEIVPEMAEKMILHEIEKIKKGE